MTEEVSMLGTEKCCRSGCERRVLVGRGYCVRHGGPAAYARGQREAKQAERKRVREEREERGAELVRQERCRAHSQGQWGTGAGKETGKTTRKRKSREFAAIAAKEAADRAARAELAKQMLSSWRERRLGEIAAELNLDLGKKPQLEMAQSFLTEEEPAERARVEAVVAKMAHVSAPKPIVAKKPKKEKKGKDEDGKGKKKGKGGKGK